MKIIAGIDYSMSCPSICIHKGDQWHFDNCVFYYFSGSKKLQFKNEKICGDPIPLFQDTNQDRWDALSGWAVSKLNGVNNVGIEGYAFGAKGQVFNIGENTGVFKHKLHKMRIVPIIFAPGAIKKFAFGKGNATKEQMYEAFLKETGFDLTKVIPTKPGGNPISDIVDSYFIAKLTHHESTKS